ncbi:putative Ig domain-containing protein [Hyalangium rubrum]|uniref:Ig domain-containing protein n=1 Tax=Hyalangium rubrum TaxID=3103134 RepID=A0ABU5HBN8_9BACT|nr:putative Ig domain-containing protein [Hyalangium sp. s54d21]MDY7230294.1 putative Ig domain-containing protein [Hyalangium sp. s54d21]
MPRCPRLIAGLLATVVALSACKNDPTPPGPGGTPPTLSEASLPETTVGVSYSATVGASGGTTPYSFSAQGLPPGLALSESGALSGSATTAGDFQVQVTVKGADGKESSKAFPLKVYSGISFPQSALPGAIVTQPYTATVELAGGKAPITLKLTASDLPSTVSLDANSHQLSGTFPALGAFAFTLEATDAHGAKATRSYAIDVTERLHIITVVYPEGYTGEAYSQPSAALGGKAPLTFFLASGALPPGLELSAATGEISGTPTQAGTFPFILGVRDALGREYTTALSITLYAPPALSAAPVLPSAYIGQPYTASVSATGGKGTLSIVLTSDTLPSGLQFFDDGSVRGTVNAAIAHGSRSTFTVEATDQNQRFVSKAFELSVFKLPELLPTTLTPATEGVSYRRSEEAPERLLAQFGQGTLTFAATGLPPGLALDASTGTLSGTPAQGSAGSYSITFSVTDAGNQRVSRTLTLEVLKPRPVSFGGAVGLAPAGSSITTTLTVFVTSGFAPLPNVGVRLRKNGQEYDPPKEALTDAEGKVVFARLDLNGTTDTVDITANGQDLVNTTFTQVNSSLFTLRMYSAPVLGSRASSSGAYDPASGRFLVFGGYDSASTVSLFYNTCFNDLVESVDVAQKRFRSLVPGGRTTSPSPRYETPMAVANGTAVLFGGRECIGTGDSLGDTWEFDLTSQAWTRIQPASQPRPRRGAAMVREPSGDSVLMVGGFRNPLYTNEVWRYTPATDTWTPLSPAPVSRAWMASAVNTGTGELWFCGGRGSATVSECMAFNPSTGAWSTKPPLPSARSEFAMAYDATRGNLYAFGGRAADVNTQFGDLLVLRPNATAWESVIPPGAVPQARSGHVMYFDTARGELVLGLGISRPNGRVIRLGDMWTYDGTAWTERGTPAPTPVSYTVRGQLTGGPGNGTAQVRLVTTSGASFLVAAPLDSQGRGTYAVPGVPPGEAVFMTVSGEDPALAYPNTLWTYADRELPALTADALVDFSLPPGPAVLLHATGELVLPASWRGQTAFNSFDAELEAPGFPTVPNSLSNTAQNSRFFDVVFTASSAPRAQRMRTYASSELACEDYTLFPRVADGSQTFSLGSSVTGISLGQRECIPHGPAGVGPARVRFSSFGSVQQLTVGDLDGDTFPDLVFPNSGSFDVDVLWGTPSLTAAFPDGICCGLSGPYAVALGDFNRDGRMDLAATEPGSNQVKVQLALAIAPRAFAEPTGYAVGTTPQGLATADVNGDGFLDLLVANQGSNTVSMLLGQSNGTFSPAQTVALAGTAPKAVRVAHLDGDNKPDLVVVVAEGLSVTLDGTTQGPFGASTLVSAGAQPSAVAVGLLNGDTLPDLAVANEGGNTVSLLFGAGGGTFASPVNLSVGTGPTALALAELTGDAHLDLAVVSPSDAEVTLLQGASNGTFTAHSKVSVAGAPRDLVAEDLNGDGLNDLAVASPTANSVYLLPGRRPLRGTPGPSFTFTAPANSGFVWVMHGTLGGRRYWDYHAPIQPGGVAYTLPKTSTLAPSSTPVEPPSGQVTLSWTPYVRQWEPDSPRRFNPRQFSLANLGQDSDTQPGALLHLWP